VGGPPLPLVPVRPSPPARRCGKIQSVPRAPPPPRGAPPRAPAPHGRGAWGLRTPTPICSPSPCIANFIFSQFWRRIEFAKCLVVGNGWDGGGLLGASQRVFASASLGRPRISLRPRGRLSPTSQSRRYYMKNDDKECKVLHAVLCIAIVCMQIFFKHCKLCRPHPGISFMHTKNRLPNDPTLSLVLFEGYS